MFQPLVQVPVDLGELCHEMQSIKSPDLLLSLMSGDASMLVATPPPHTHTHGAAFIAHDIRFDSAGKFIIQFLMLRGRACPTIIFCPLQYIL
jgi:hypothetical protein